MLSEEIMAGSNLHAENGAKNSREACALEIQRGYGSRLALSLGDLDIPQLLAERDLHQGEVLGMSPSNASEPLGGDHFGGVLGNSLMLNNLGCGGSLPAPKPFPAGDPSMVTMMHNLAHWSEKARQEQAQLAQQAQQHSGREAPHLSAPFHQDGLESPSCSPTISSHAGMDPSAAFRFPPGGSFSVPSPGGGPSITSGAKLGCVGFSDGGRPGMSGDYGGCSDRGLTGQCDIPISSKCMQTDNKQLPAKLHQTASC